MEADKYKAQFINFIKTTFPNGYDSETPCIQIRCNRVTFEFNFDFADLNSKTFEDRLTKKDVKLLKEMNIEI